MALSLHALQKLSQENIVKRADGIVRFAVRKEKPLVPAGTSGSVVQFLN